MKRIGFYCNWPVVRRADGYYVSSIDMRYLRCASGFGSSINLLCSVHSGRCVKGLEKIDTTHVKVIELPEFQSYFESIVHFRDIVLGIRLLVRESEFVYLRSPEPFSWVAAFFKRKGVILNYHYASSPIEVILKGEQDSLLKKLTKVILFYPEYLMIAVASYFNRSSVNGRAAAKKLPFFLRSKARVSYESSITKLELSNKRYRSVLDSETIRFLSVCRLQSGKGMLDLIDGFALLHAEQPDMCFVLDIVGDGPMRKELEARVEQKNLNYVVRFFGNVANGPSLNLFYSSSDVFVMTSHSETGPRVLIEALSESNFCIATDVGYVREVLNGRAGLVIEPGNVPQIYDSLCWVFKNRALAKTIAYKGFIASRAFSIDSFFEDIVGC